MYTHTYVDIFKENTSKVQGCLALSLRILQMMLTFFTIAFKISAIIQGKKCNNSLSMGIYIQNLFDVNTIKPVF